MKPLRIRLLLNRVGVEAAHIAEVDDLIAKAFPLYREVASEMGYMIWKCFRSLLVRIVRSLKAIIRKVNGNSKHRNRGCSGFRVCW